MTDEPNPAAAPEIAGYQLLARALRRQQVAQVFFLMGAPMLDAASACRDEGLRMIDTRHEQAAAMMAHAAARLTARPGVCMACSGPGAINLSTGLANALIDCAPVVALGGSTPLAQLGRGAFQEIDQLAIMRPVTKWAARVHTAAQIPDMVDQAFARARAGKPGPVYLDLPGDVLYQTVPADRLPPQRPLPGDIARPQARSDQIATMLDLLAEAERPVIIAGSGVIWSGAGAQLHDLARTLGIPVYTTPQGRGPLPEDDPLIMPGARSTALKEADLVLILGTRLNYVFSYARPPRFAPRARLVRIDIDPEEIATSNRLTLGVVGDLRAVLDQLLAVVSGRVSADRFAPWRGYLEGINAPRQVEQAERMRDATVPIHPLRLCGEIAGFMDRDAVLVVDGQEILNYARQSIPCFIAGNRLNSGPFGTMGVGVPFGVGARAVRPDSQVIVLTGDGAFGLNGMEIDTALRHKLPVLIVVSLNGGWTADPDRRKVGRDLGYTRYDQMAVALGGHGEFVEHPDAIAPALQRARAAVANGQTAVVNVVTDWRARANIGAFTSYKT